MGLIIKSNIRKVVKELDKENSISSVADEVETALERRTEEILENGIKRARANGRRTSETILIRPSVEEAIFGNQKQSLKTIKE